jgi:hypothetical protein
MKHEDVMSPRWGNGYASYWPPFVSVHPSIWSIWEALAHLACFAFES